MTDIIEPPSDPDRFGAVNAPDRPSNIGRFTMMARWVTLITRHDSILGSDTVGVALAIAGHIGPNWDARTQMVGSKIANILRCDPEVVWRAVDVLAEHKLIIIENDRFDVEGTRRAFVRIGIGK